MWERVVWTDESAFRCGIFGKVYITRTPEEAFEDDCLIPRFRNFMSVMVWGLITAKGDRRLHIFNKGETVTGDVYRDKILLQLNEFARIYEEEVYQLAGIIIQQDNAPCHTAKATFQKFLDYGLEVMEWPSNSPDLNPIEHLGVFLKQRISRHCPSTRAEVEEAIKIEWARITHNDIRRICQSMKERCQAVIAAKGGHTKW